MSDRHKPSVTAQNLRRAVARAAHYYGANKGPSLEEAEIALDGYIAKLEDAFREAFESVQEMVGQHGGRETCLSANEGGAWILEEFAPLYQALGGDKPEDRY